MIHRHPERILVPINDKLLPVNVDDIACFYATNGSTTVFKSNGESHAYGKTLNNVMLSLSPEKFCRANKQFILSKKSISGITIWFDNRLLVSLTIQVPEQIYISKNKASEFRQWITS